MSACGNCRGQQTCLCKFESLCSEHTFLGESITLSGVSGEYISTPDTAINSIVGDLDIRMKIAPTDWTPASNQTLMAKFVTTGNQRSFLFRLTTTGALALVHSPDGTATATHTSTAVNAFVDGSTHWVRVNVDVNDGVGNFFVRFFTSENGIDWTELGVSQTGAAYTIFDSTSPIELGSNTNGTAELFNGKIYKAELRRGPNLTVVGSVNSFEGEIVAKFEPSRAIVTGAQTPTTVTSAFGETWSIHGIAWTWSSILARTCTTLTGNGKTYAPINYRPNNVPLPRPYGDIIRSTDQAIAASTVTFITFDTSLTPFSGGMIDLTADPTALTVPVEGYYLVSYTLSAKDNLMTLSIQKIGIETMSIAFQQMYGILPGATYSAVTLIHAAAGDKFKIQIASEAGPGGTVFKDYFTTTLPNSHGNTFPRLTAQWMRAI